MTPPEGYGVFLNTFKSALGWVPGLWARRVSLNTFKTRVSHLAKPVQQCKNYFDKSPMCSPEPAVLSVPAGSVVTDLELPERRGEEVNPDARADPRPRTR